MYKAPKLKEYAGYKVLNKANIEDNLRSTIEVLERSRDTMVKPLMFHFVCEIVDVELFPEKFIQALKEKFSSVITINNRERRKLNALSGDDETKLKRRKVERQEIIYSIETKEDKTNPLYNHVHIMWIVDAGHNSYGSKELGILLNKALNRIDGLEKIVIVDDFNMIKSDGTPFNHGFLKFRDRNSTILADDAKFVDVRCHNLHEEFNDAIIRASYLAKDSQKSKLPERFKDGSSFNRTRVKRKSV